MTFYFCKSKWWQKKKKKGKTLVTKSDLLNCYYNITVIIILVYNIFKMEYNIKWGTEEGN